MFFSRNPHIVDLVRCILIDPKAKSDAKNEQKTEAFREKLQK